MNANPVVRLRDLADRLASPRLALGVGLLYLVLLVAVLPLLLSVTVTVALPVRSLLCAVHLESVSAVTV